MKNKLICTALAFTTLLSGCKGETAAQLPFDNLSAISREENSEVTFTDHSGKPVTVCSPKKAAAFSASLAEAWQLAGGEISFATSDAFDDEKIVLPNY